MRLRKLEIKNFRNYSQQLFEPCPSLNIISGDNAQGKTNIIEAIYFACAGRSFRTFKEGEMINWEGDFALIRAYFETAERELEIKITLTEGQKKIKINEAPAKRFPFGWPGAIIFTPDSLNVIKGSPQIRRSFLDLEMGPINNQYDYSLKSYQRVLQQRNNLLRDIKEGKENTELLKTWNNQLSLYGSKIISFRLMLLNNLNKKVKRIYSELTQGSEDISFRYNSSLKIRRGMDEKEIIKSYEKAIGENEKEDIYRGQSLIGPHRDDIIFLINKKEARTYGSQGQQRSLILALKLSLIEMWYNVVGEYPILLMDDVMSELDETRQKELLRIIGGNVQTFISSSVFSDISIVKEPEKKCFVVREGVI